MLLPDDWAPRFMRVLGDELRIVRTRRGWTRLDLLHRLPDDISLQTLATYELGTRNMYVPRFVSVCLALDVSPTDIIQRTFERIFDNGDQQAGWTVDLVAASKLTRPELAPLRRWAADRLESTWASGPKIVRLTRGALEPLAMLCGLTTLDLARQLPQPRITHVE